MGRNPEGLTWSEWAYAAGIPEPVAHGVKGRAPHWHTGHAKFFTEERRAWRAGEDPTEWRVFLEKTAQTSTNDGDVSRNNPSETNLSTEAS